MSNLAWRMDSLSGTAVMKKKDQERVMPDFYGALELTVAERRCSSQLL